MSKELCINPGVRFGRLVVEGEVQRRQVGVKMARFFWLACDCGNHIAVSLRDLRSGNSRSCGCLKTERITRMGHEKETHGESTARTPEYNSWRMMKERCLNPNKASFERYGGRGVEVCKEWRDDFSAFLASMGRKPSAKHTLDRIDVNGNYEPDNCRWATPKEQANNRRRPMRYTNKAEI